MLNGFRTRTREGGPQPLRPDPSYVVLAEKQMVKFARDCKGVIREYFVSYIEETMPQAVRVG